MQIFLIGFMGSGKTTIGENLAARLDLPFTDSDSWIEEKEERSISEIFAQEGEAYFRSLERECILQLDTESRIIACGGGLPCFNGLIDGLKKKGIVIFLETGVATILENLGDQQIVRPLLHGMSREEMEQTTSRLLELRQETYRQAHHRILTDGKSVESITTGIIELLHL